MVAVELGIADQLEEGPRTAEELAVIVGANPDALDRMLAFLVSAGLLGRTRDGRYKNNAVSNTLRRSHPRSPRDWVLFAGANWLWDAWNQLGHSVRTGESGMVKAHGMSFFDYVGSGNPAAGTAFTRALACFSRLQSPIVATKYDFSAVNRLCDVGGGSGTLLAEVLKANPNVVGVLFEVPQVLAAGKETLATQGLTDRCEFIAGNFLESVPTGCDHYVLQFVLHDWNADSCAAILGNVKAAMPSNGRVLVIEAVLDGNGRDPWTLRASDLLMLVLTGSGRERTRDEFAALFERSGFRLARDVTLPSLLHVFELVSR
ncbi:MAG: acetylserotonin O-methyltransferase [Candidatus Dormibacteraeota bacterium]|nr:acetylserotonin O-methyltransferase [Candidatus Dormibacteraeota bacterium]